MHQSKPTKTGKNDSPRQKEATSGKPSSRKKPLIELATTKNLPEENATVDLGYITFFPRQPDNE